MRVALLLVAIVVGCDSPKDAKKGSEASPAPTPKDDLPKVGPRKGEADDSPKRGGVAVKKAEPIPSLNEKDPVETCKWIAFHLNKSRDFPKGNAVAGQAALATFNSTIGSLKGKVVEWPVTGGDIDVHGRLTVAPIEVVYAKNGPERRYGLRLIHTLKSDPSRIEMENYQSSPHCFPLGNPPWLAKAKSGDRYTLKGEIKDISPTQPILPDREIDQKQLSWAIRFGDYVIVPTK